jgi:phosphoribosyl 1,2-cyclic phosphodiesterase
MLQNGSYPYALKRRILSDIGHLSNDTCAHALPGLVEQGSTRFVLAHLSKENNIPALAYQTSLAELTMHGMRQNVDFQLSVAPRENTGGMMIF